MARFKKNNKGQALTEMMIAIPLLFLLTAGTVQFAILFQARCAFDKACGEAARQYAAGRINDQTAITNILWQDLGAYQNYFSQQSLTLSTQSPQTTMADTFLNHLSFLGAFTSQIKSYIFNYAGQNWTFTISCTPSFMTIIFPSGIQFHSQISFIKYPS
ncbi:MAG TPA: TadE/TadG family type IV pilus assembly protein [bacterium]|jgi:Flp pilus assembly protein TadG|nr:TadE/TadG family type IV pilus assembly protein [bacterium]